MRAHRLNTSQIAPESTRALQGVEAYPEQSGPDKQLANLVRMRASPQINGCAYGFDMHSKGLRRLGETEQRLYVLSGWRESPAFTPRERAALAWSDALTLIADAQAPTPFTRNCVFQRQGDRRPDDTHRHDQSLEPVGDRHGFPAPDEAPAMRAIVRSADSGSEVAACFAVMAQPRPHLADAAEFALIAGRQKAGRRLLGAPRDGVPVALAGYRFAENLVHGRFVGVADLVTTKDARGGGPGGRLLVAEAARQHGIERLVLDTALDNGLAHRFYSRQGLLARALRFSRPVAR